MHMPVCSPSQAAPFRRRPQLAPEWVPEWAPAPLPLLLLCVLLPWPGGVAAIGAGLLNPDHPQRYTVQPGDTLWSIAGRFLRDPWRWQEVWESNPGVDNPNRIFPGDALELIYRGDGSPRVQRADGGMPVVRLSPRIRVTEIEREVPSIPVNAIAPFLSRPVVVEAPGEIDNAPYVAGFPEGRILAGIRDDFFVRKILDARAGRWEVLRPGRTYRDPETNEVLGYEALFVAEAALDRTGDPATLRVLRSALEVQVGDRLRPARDETAVRSFLPQPAPHGLEGQIIAVLGGVTQIGQFDIVVLNRGGSDGVELGHVFEVFRGGNLRRDPVRSRQADWNWRNETPLDTSFWFGEWRPTGWRRDRPDANAPMPLQRQIRRPLDQFIVPDSRSGVIMVFRIFPRVSFALVMTARQAIQVGEIVARPRD
ncbi:MAG: LysM domain-containing protein [Chromatiaceae bacterium]|nr:MAG: LysM domain-containing protein [Chromatiaceae bacterium]